MAENEKQVNIKNQSNYFFYVHYSKKTYLEDLSRDAKLYQFDSLEDKTRQHYRLLRNRANRKMLALNNTFPAGVEVTEIINQLDDFLKNDKTSPITLSDIKSINKLNLNANSLKSKLKDAQTAAEALDKYINETQQLINKFEKIDENLKTFYRNATKSQKKNLKEFFQVKSMEDLSVTTIGKTSLTAMTAIKDGLEALKQNQKNLETNFNQLFHQKKQKSQDYKISYTPLDSEEKKTVVASDVFNSISGNASNLRGAIGEVFIGLFTIVKNEELVEYFQNQLNQVEGLKITTRAEGEKTDKRTRSKADASVSFNGQYFKMFTNGNTDLLNFVTQLNISVKNTKSKRKSVPTSRFKALTTRFYYLFSRLSDKDQKYQYVLANFAALNNRKGNVKDSDFNKKYFTSTANATRRYIAAKNMEWALEGAGDNKVQVLAFMNQAITINQYYGYIANYPSNLLPSVSIASVADKNTPIPAGAIINPVDDTPDTKNVAAIWRSQKVKEALKSAEATIWG